MIIDLQRFIAEEKPYWEELALELARLENDPFKELGLDQVRRFHYLYQRASADLAKIRTFSAEPATIRFLEDLVARAFGEIHETRPKWQWSAPWHWFIYTFPRTFRRRRAAFLMALAVTIAGALFGALALAVDYDHAKAAIIPPFPHLQGNPMERVAMEERDAVKAPRSMGEETYMTSFYVTHNTKVSILTLALGATWGIGTIIMLFYNGVILGAITFDYAQADTMTFLIGWLLPHGATEIPAILLAGQGGFVLAGALIGWGDRSSLRARLRRVRPDLVTLIVGVALLLSWAAIVEAFLSQYHEPVIPYWVKIAFGVMEVCLLAAFLGLAGRRVKEQRA